MANYVLRMTKVCQYCRRLYTPKDIYQRYCDECTEERMKKFKANRTFKVCPKCRTTFLSVGGKKYCDRCSAVFGLGGTNGKNQQ